jgi:hypothetical protein
MESGVLYISLHSGHSNPFTDKNNLYPPFHGFSRLEHHVCLGNTKYKQNLTLLKAIQGYCPTGSILSFWTILLYGLSVCLR